MNGYNWTTTETAVLREHYPKGGVKPCAELLPHRTGGAIQQQAAKLNIKAPSRLGSRRSWPNSDDIDRQIINCYTVNYKHGAIKALAERLNRPHWWVKNRAQVLGVSQPTKRDRPWTYEEITLLEEYQGKTPEIIRRALKRRGFKRTRTAITVKRKKLGISARPTDSYSGCELAQLMGVNNATVAKWCRQGWIKADRRDTQRTEKQGGDIWHIKPEAVRRFVIDYTAHVDVRKVDKFWFIDLLTGSSQAKGAAA